MPETNYFENKTSIFTDFFIVPAIEKDDTFPSIKDFIEIPTTLHRLQPYDTAVYLDSNRHILRTQYKYLRLHCTKSGKFQLATHIVYTDHPIELNFLRYWQTYNPYNDPNYIHSIVNSAIIKDTFENRLMSLNRKHYFYDNKAAWIKPRQRTGYQDTADLLNDIVSLNEPFVLYLSPNVHELNWHAQPYNELDRGTTKINRLLSAKMENGNTLCAYGTWSEITVVKSNNIHSVHRALLFCPKGYDIKNKYLECLYDVNELVCHSTR